MPDYSAWALVDAYTVEQAACLWVGAEPAQNAWSRTDNESYQIAPVTQMLIAAIQSGELPADSSANPTASIGYHEKSLVKREDLRVFAESKNKRPAFLFDTIMPEGAKGERDDSKQAERPQSRIGRPPEYDWNAFTIEIIRIADLDGLPEKQSELIVQMLEWCEDSWGKQPAESAAKKRISEIYNGLGRGQKGQ